MVDNERIEELPLNGRNATDLIALAPAAVPQPGLNATSRSMGGGQAFAVAGGQAFGVAYLLDGATHNNPYDNLNLPLPFPDALQEFRLETSSTTANAGMHSGASVNAVTKSGTNLFHGDVFEFSRNHRFNATNPFNARDPVTGERQGDGLNRHQYGGTFSGPIVSDRVFFFGAFQGTRIRETPADLFAFVPTAAMLAGDFTAYASAACNNGTARTLGRALRGQPPRPGAHEPGGAEHRPAPAGHHRPVRPRDLQPQPPQDDSQYIGKMDVQLSQNHSLFGRYIFTANKLTPPLELQPDNLLVSSLGGRDNKAHSFTAGDTMVLSNSMVNAFRVAYNYTDIHRTHAPLGFDTTDLGIKTYSYLEDYMLVAVNNGGFSLGGGTESEARFKTPSINFTDDLTLIKGDHQYGFGASVSWWKSLSQANVRSPGQFTFTGTNTGLPLADFLSGSLNTLIQATPELARHAAAVSGPLRAGHVEVLAQGHVELRPAVGAGPRAADPQRRDLQLQRRSVPGRRADHAVHQRAAGIPVSRRRGLRQRQGRHQGPLAAVLAPRGLRLGSGGRRPDVGSRRLLAGV